MRILHIISSLKRGGAESLLVDLVVTLNKPDDEHHVIYFHTGPHVQSLQECGVKNYHIKGIFCLYDPFFCIRLYKLIKKINPDCIHGWLWSANFFGRIIARMLRIPQISALHNNVDQDGLVRNVLDKYTYRYATKLVPVADGIAHSVVERYPFISLASMYVIKNGINSHEIVQKATLSKYIRADFGFAAEHFVIGSVGRFVPLKNYPLLLDAFAQVHKKHPQTRLLLVGSGPDEQPLRNKVARLGLKNVVTFIIDQPSYNYYQLFNCFTLSSFKEGISMALLEAMSCSLPCVMTNQGKHDVITHAKDGILVESENVMSLAKGLKTLVENKNYARQLGQAAHVTVVSHFNREHMINEYKKLYEMISPKS